MLLSPLNNNKGLALVLAIGIIALLTILALQFQRSNVLERAMATNFKNGVEAMSVARSGVQVAMALLEQDRQENEYDTYFDKWSNFEDVIGGEEKLFPGAEWRLKISPVNSAININRLVDKEGKFDPLQKDLWERILNSGELAIDDMEPDDIINSIKDWLDPDSKITGFGGEDEYYLSLPHPYRCKNGPITTVGELLFIKGITSSLYYGDDKHVGLKDLITVFGDGAININVASKKVIRVLDPEIDDDMVEDLIDFRKAEDHQEELADPSWYKKVPGWGTINLPSGLVTVKSEYFKVKSSAKVVYSKKTVQAILHRKGEQIEIIYWRIY